MFELAILYIILNMATSNLNQNNEKTKSLVAIALKKHLFTWTVLSTLQCQIFNFILSVSCNNENKWMVTLHTVPFS